MEIVADNYRYEFTYSAITVAIGICPPLFPHHALPSDNLLASRNLTPLTAERGNMHHYLQFVRKIANEFITK